MAEWDTNSSEVEATLRGREMTVTLAQCGMPIAARSRVSSACIHEVHLHCAKPSLVGEWLDHCHRAHVPPNGSGLIIAAAAIQTPG
jgi:hypothetical protein